MIVGQQVLITVGGGQREQAGIVVAYCVASCADQGAIDVRERIVVQLYEGAFRFVPASAVRVVAPEQLPRQVERAEQVAVQPDEPGHRAHVREVQDRTDRRQQPARGPVCPTHKIAVASRKGPRGAVFCPASTPDGYCNWSYVPEAAAVS